MLQQVSSISRMRQFKSIEILQANLESQNCKRNGWRHFIYTPRDINSYKDKYKGQWRNDKKCGKGQQIGREGMIYEGEWWNNHRHGYGVLSVCTAIGHMCKLYAGDWIAGKRQGFGCKWYRDGGYYEGSFSQNKRQGYGSMWYRDGSYYQGTWDDDRKHGTGVFIQVNGNRYEGQFIRDKKDGRGVFYLLNTGQVQFGNWKNDSCVSSVMKDIYQRQFAPNPTQYPLPKLLDQFDDIN